MKTRVGEVWEEYEKKKKEIEELKKLKKDKEAIEKVVYPGKIERITFRVLPRVKRIIRELEEITDWNKYEVINYLILKGYETIKDREKTAFEIVKKERELLKWE